MLPKEAIFIGDLLATLPDDQISPCLNLGSSTKEFRTLEQPHIDRDIFRPLQARGVDVRHVDQKNADGVDLAGDLGDPSFVEKIREMEPRLLICSNLLEHVQDPAGFAGMCARLLPSGGWLLATVPYSYPFHSDPIDNGLRPTPEELAALFPGLEMKTRAILVEESYLSHFRKLSPGGRLRRLGGDLLRLLLLPVYGVTQFKNRFHRYLWFFRPYKVTIVLMQRTA